MNSADHALRNHVSRLRKVLGRRPATSRVSSRARPATCCASSPASSTSSASSGSSRTGARRSRAATPQRRPQSFARRKRLWQGRPLADLELEPFARFEVERLEELRLAAVEERIDAELALGRQLALVPELETLAAEHPLPRALSRAADARALPVRVARQRGSRCTGRRGRCSTRSWGSSRDASCRSSSGRSSCRTRRSMPTPTVARRLTRRPRRDVCPFKGLAPFEAADAEFFFGRERLVDELVGTARGRAAARDRRRVGSGKSSLLRAGLLPALGTRAGVVRPGERAAALTAASARPWRRPRRVPVGERSCVAVDQFEELFAPPSCEDERRAFVDALVEAAWDPERRGSCWSRCAPTSSAVWRRTSSWRISSAANQRPARADDAEPSCAARSRARRERAGLEVEPALVDALVDDVAGEPGALPLLSTALRRSLARTGRPTLTLASYERTGGVRGAVGRHAEAAFAVARRRRAVRSRAGSCCGWSRAATARR